MELEPGIMTVKPKQPITSPLGEFPDIEAGSTRDLILQAAGRLFAAKGFHGTPAREIAEAVGIRKPSLFHHFASKTDMAQHLLEYDRLRSPLLLDDLDLPEAAPPIGVYQILRREISVELTSRYELRGLYLTDVLQEPDFGFWKDQYGAALARMRALIQQGIDGGSFVDQPPSIFELIFDSVLHGIVRLERRQPKEADPDVIATVLMRSILKRSDEVKDIRAAADRALEMARVPADSL